MDGMSMGKRLAAIIGIFLCTCVAWAILGSTIFARTYSFGDDLKSRVASTWGTRQEQKPPLAHYTLERTKEVEYYEKGNTYKRLERYNTTEPLVLEGSDINVKLDLEHRQKGLLWYSTYKIQFGGDYQFRNDSAEPHPVTFELPYPASQAIYDDLQFAIDGKPIPVNNANGVARSTAVVPANSTVTLHTEYRSHGLDQWQYTLGEDISQVRDFALRMTTNFADIDFPQNTLSATTKKETANGWLLEWKYNNLVSGYQIGMVMPEKLQPGPLAGQISYFAPVSLLFFFFLMFIITTLRGIELHPMNYFFLATAFFAFHLLMAYLVDHISIHLAFAISAVVSMFLVVSYLRLVIGLRFAAMEAAGAQFIYLVLFSYAFFFKGYTGLSVTIGAIITLFVVMQMTGRIRWAERFAGVAQRA
jgi:inner membrane protein involved in colicin E2 resistance